jgi:hypothetical protein
MAKGLMGAEETRRAGPGSRGGTGSSWSPKRQASKPTIIKRKLDAGVPREDTPERGVLRLSKTATDILVGIEDISTWDNEEIRRGRRRGKNGTFVGRSPVVVPMALHQEAIKRTFEEAQELMREGLVPAVKYLTAIINDPDVEPKDKLKATQMILDRVLGKAVERVEIKTGTEPWEDALVAAVVPLDVSEATPKEEEEDAAVDPSP